MAIINDMIYGTNLIPGVVPKLNYRSDIVQNIPRWIVSAIRYITDNYPFEELSRQGPIVALTPGQAVYPITTFIAQPPAPAVNLTRFDSFLLFLNPGFNITTPLSGSSPSIELKWRGIKVVQQLSFILSMPVMYNIYGAAAGSPGGQAVIIAFCPSAPWNVKASYQEKHPFTDGLNDTIQLPDAWLEVVANTAALIGAEENRMTDNIQMLRAVLYGDPQNPQRPGLINALVSSRAQFSNVNERQLNMVAEI